MKKMSQFIKLSNNTHKDTLNSLRNKLKVNFINRLTLVLASVLTLWCNAPNLCLEEMQI